MPIPTSTSLFCSPPLPPQGFCRTRAGRLPAPASSEAEAPLWRAGAEWTAAWAASWRCGRCVEWHEGQKVGILKGVAFTPPPPHNWGMDEYAQADAPEEQYENGRKTLIKRGNRGNRKAQAARYRVRNRAKRREYNRKWMANKRREQRGTLPTNE